MSIEISDALKGGFRRFASRTGGSSLSATSSRSPSTCTDTSASWPGSTF